MRLYSVYYISVGSSTCFVCWHPSSGARTTAMTAPVACPVWQLHTSEGFEVYHIPGPVTVNYGNLSLMSSWWHVVIIELMKCGRFQASAAVCLSPFPIWDLTHRRLFTDVSGKLKGPLNYGANRLFRNFGSQIPTYIYQFFFILMGPCILNQI